MSEQIIPDADVKHVVDDLVHNYEINDPDFLAFRVQELVDNRNHQARNERSLRYKREGMITFYKKFLSPGDLVFDVGANIGERTEIFRAVGANVVAIEPHPKCVAELIHRFENDRHVVVAATALGSSDGTGALFTGSCTNISSMSRPWIQAVLDFNRFGGDYWTEQVNVPISTLDALIVQHGKPKFIKIDAEGSEPEILTGLSHSVPLLSFEFVTDCLEAASKCVARLESLGPVRFTYSPKETMELHPEWISGSEVMELLQHFTHDHSMYGDVYARFE